jgi:hypothetical protein
VENGNDLLNRTLFATSNFRTLVAGLTVRLGGGWDLQMEAFRNQLTSELNPENAFLLLGQGVPAQLVFSGFNQKSAYLRLSKHFGWGETRPAGGIDRYADEQNLLRGKVQGTVLSMGLAGPLVARGVTVSLDGYRSVVTDELGAFSLADVPVGSHSVALALRELPAEYDPGSPVEVSVRIEPGRSTAVMLEVWRLGSIRGVVISADRRCLESSRLRLQPTGRYTTSEPDGTFSFDNVREGEYAVSLETVETSISCAPQGEVEQRRQVRSDAATGAIRFEVQAVETVKPIRRIALQP